MADRAEIELLASTGVAEVDEILRGVVGAYEAAFPGRIASYYLKGSYASGSHVPASDVDLLILFEGSFEPGEVDRAAALRDAYRRLSPMHLDLPARALENIWAEEPFVIRYASVLVYGRDVTAEITLPSVAEYAREISEAPQLFMRLLRDGGRLADPLSYPDPGGEFMGYDRPLKGPALGAVRGLKDWVLTVGWIATALTAIQAGEVTLRKDDAPAMYRTHVGDDWADFVDAVFALGKARCQYRLPEDEADRATLRDLCRQTLDFENHFMAVYRRQLRAELASVESPRQRRALKRLEGLAPGDPEIAARLQHLARGADEQLALEAAAVLASWSSG